MKLLVDMNLSPRWIDLLTQSQFEAVHWLRVGKPHSFDEAIMIVRMTCIHQHSGWELQSNRYNN